MDPIKDRLVLIALTVLCAGCVPGGSSPDPWESEIIANNSLGQVDQLSGDEPIPEHGAPPTDEFDTGITTADSGTGEGGNEQPPLPSLCQTERLAEGRHQVICHVESGLAERCSQQPAISTASTFEPDTPNLATYWAAYPVLEGAAPAGLTPCIGFEYEGETTPHVVIFHIRAFTFKGGIFPHKPPPTEGSKFLGRLPGAGTPPGSTSSQPAPN